MIISQMFSECFRHFTRGPCPGAGLYGYKLRDAGIGRRGNAVERLKARHFNPNP